MKLPITEQLEAWRAAKWNTPHIAWAGAWLENGFCPDCRLCCGPQPGDDPFPMRLLPSQLEKSSRALYMLDRETACIDERGCKALGEQGCMLQRFDRPVACGLFPLVLCNGGLYLYQICPAVIILPLSEWLGIAHKAFDWIMSLPPSDRERIAIELPNTTVSERYIFLHRTFPAQ